MLAVRNKWYLFADSKFHINKLVRKCRELITETGFVRSCHRRSELMRIELRFYLLVNDLFIRRL